MPPWTPHPLRGAVFGGNGSTPPLARVMCASLGYRGLFGLTHWLLNPVHLFNARRESLELARRTPRSRDRNNVYPLPGELLRQPRPGDDEGMRLATACSQASNRLQARPLEGDRVPDAINSIDICRRLVVP